MIIDKNVLKPTNKMHNYAGNNENIIENDAILTRKKLVCCETDL
jgi:hypothetical protein